MSLRAVLLPLFVEVILTFALMLWMGALRQGDYRSGAVRVQDVALREPGWPGARCRPRTPIPISSSFLSCSTYSPSWNGSPARRLRLRHPGMDFRDLSHAACLRACHEQCRSPASPVRLIGPLVLTIMWVIYVVEVLTGVYHDPVVNWIGLKNLV